MDTMSVKVTVYTAVGILGLYLKCTAGVATASSCHPNGLKRPEP